MRRIKARLNKIFTLGLGDQRLQLSGSECVHQACLRYDQEKDLGTSKSRKLVGLVKIMSCGRIDYTDECSTFFIIPSGRHFSECTCVRQKRNQTHQLSFWRM